MNPDRERSNFEVALGCEAAIEHLAYAAVQQHLAALMRRTTNKKGENEENRRLDQERRRQLKSAAVSMKHVEGRLQRPPFENTTIRPETTPGCVFGFLLCRVRFASPRSPAGELVNSLESPLPNMSPTATQKGPATLLQNHTHRERNTRQGGERSSPVKESPLTSSVLHRSNRLLAQATPENGKQKRQPVPSLPCCEKGVRGCGIQHRASST